MAIWISRYSNKELQSGKYYPVGISIGTPKFPLGYTLRKQCYSLAPKGYMLNMELDRFKPAYYEKLEGIGTDRIIDMVEKMNTEARAEGKELVLLCYEDVRVPGDWCHRTVFAEWWAEQTGELIEELYDPSEPKVKKPAAKNRDFVDTLLDNIEQEKVTKMRTAMLTRYPENKEVRGIMKLVNRVEDKKNGYKLTYEAELVEGRTEQQTLQEWLRRENEWQKNRAKASSKSKDAK